MPKYFADTYGSGLQLADDTVHHLKKVMRVRIGDEIILCDGRAMDYHCTVESVEPFNVRIEERRPCENEPECKITLYQAMPKHDKFEWIVQKAVELGVHEIVPVTMEHCVKMAKTTKTARYQKIAESAAGQSMRGIVPKVHEPASWKEVFERAMAEMRSGSTMLAAHPNKYTSCGMAVCRGHAASRKQGDEGAESSPRLKALGLWIGPEGGFSVKEVQSMEEANFCFINLGPRILRTETAAIAALALLLCRSGT